MKCPLTPAHRALEKAVNMRVTDLKYIPIILAPNTQNVFTLNLPAVFRADQITFFMDYP